MKQQTSIKNTNILPMKNIRLKMILTFENENPKLKPDT